MKLPLREEPLKITIRLFEKDGPIKKELLNTLLKIKRSNPRAKISQNWAWIEAMKEWIAKHS